MSWHTPTPWAVSELDSETIISEGDCDGLDIICNAPEADTDSYAKYWKANAARIVACVNACEGLDDPQALRADNARLREALANLLADATSFGMADSKYSGVLIEARAALAKVES